ncbi:hypothetical protein LZ32DRAFT_601130 [Colletotrichum eremochloae]|nr:hypothetical protein LZ32DRAFT_601130 [Colletotrichum eremochloae]
MTPPDNSENSPKSCCTRNPKPGRSCACSFCVHNACWDCIVCTNYYAVRHKKSRFPRCHPRSNHSKPSSSIDHSLLFSSSQYKRQTQTSQHISAPPPPQKKKKKATKKPLGHDFHLELSRRPRSFSKRPPKPGKRSAPESGKGAREGRQKIKVKGSKVPRSPTLHSAPCQSALCDGPDAQDRLTGKVI